MDKLIEFFNGFELQNLIAMTAAIWYFTREIRNDIKKEIEEMKKENSAQARRTDKLYEMFIELLNNKK